MTVFFSLQFFQRSHPPASSLLLANDLVVSGECDVEFVPLQLGRQDHRIALLFSAQDRPKSGLITPPSDKRPPHGTPPRADRPPQRGPLMAGTPLPPWRRNPYRTRHNIRCHGHHDPHFVYTELTVAASVHPASHRKPRWLPRNRQRPRQPGFGPRQRSPGRSGLYARRSVIRGKADPSHGTTQPPGQITGAVEKARKILAGHITKAMTASRFFMEHTDGK